MQNEESNTNPDTNSKITGNNSPDNSADITNEVRALLDASFEDDEEGGLHSAELDTVDEDGEMLEEESSSTARMGSDLDVPGADLDDTDEDKGEEDEENNVYTQSDTE